MWKSLSFQHLFNAMADGIELHIKQLQEEKEKQKDFLDRITHELKNTANGNYRLCGFNSEVTIERRCTGKSSLCGGGK